MIPFLGIVCGCLALFFAFVAGLTYFKIKKLFSLIDESQYDAVMPIVDKQKKRINVEMLLCALLTIATVVLSLIHNL